MLTAAVLRHLDSLGLVVFGRDGADAFLEEAPAEVDQSIAIVAQPGHESVVWEMYDRPDFQIVCQGGPQPRRPWRRLIVIAQALHGLRYETIAAGSDDEVHVQAIFAKQAQPVSLGKTEGGMFRMSMGFRAQIVRTAQLTP